MANVLKFELNRAGVGELLKGPEMQRVLSGYAEQMRGRCKDSDEYEVVTKVLGTRAVSIVRTASNRAYSSNLKNNDLLKAVGTDD